MLNADRKPQCCRPSDGFVYWHTADAVSGPAADGWAMCYGATEEAYFELYVNVAFCPFCGSRLPDRKGQP